MIAHPRCRVCQRVHGLPRCEPQTEPVTPEPVANTVANTVANRPGKAGKYKDAEARRAYMREFMRRKRAAE